MSLARWSDLLDDVMPHVPGASIEVVTHAIKRATIEFCNKSLVLRAMSDPLDLVAGENTIDLDSPVSGTQCAKALVVRIEGQTDPLEARTMAQLDEWRPNWRTESGAIRYFTQESPEQLMLAMLPESSVPGAVSVYMAVAPTLQSAGVDSWLFQRHGEAIASGALGRLMASPKKPYTDLNLAAAHMGAFRSEIGNAAAIAERGYGRAPMRTQACV